MKNMKKIFLGFGVSAFALLGGFVGFSQSNIFDSQINEIVEADASVTIELNEQGVYEISTADQLALVSKQIADGVEGYRSASYMLTADINLGTKLWTPIGTADNAFTGDFNGNGYTISNLIVTNESAIDGYYGLFGKVNGGGIYNIILDSGYTTSTTNASGNLAGSVENCFIGGIYDKNTLGKTIGTVGNGVKFYQGDLSSPNTITARSGSVSITGYLKTYIAHGGIIADSNNYGARIYKESCIVPTTDSSRSSLSSDNFSGFNGVRVGNLNNPSYVYKVGNEGTWVTGSTYTKTVSWTDKSSVSFTFNKPAHEENELADDTVLGYYGKTYEEIVSYLNAYNENFDLIKLELGNVTLFSETVRYSPQGAKITNDTDYLQRVFLETSNATFVATWQGKEVQTFINFNFENGGKIDNIARSLSYAEDYSQIELNNELRFAVHAGAPLKMSLSVPFGYNIKFDSSVGTVEKTSGNNLVDDYYPTGDYVFTLPNGFVSRPEDGLKIHVKRTGYQIAVNGVGDLSGVMISGDNYGTVEYSNATIFVHADDAFGITFTPNTGYKVMSASVTNVTPNAISSRPANQDALTLAFQGITNISNNASINLAVAKKSVNITSYGIKIGNDSTLKGSETLLDAGTDLSPFAYGSGYLLNGDTNYGSAAISLDSNMNLKVLAIEDDKYRVAGVLFTPSFGTASEVTTKTGDYYQLDVTDAVAAGKTFTVYVLLEVKTHNVSISFDQVKDFNGDEISVNSSIATFTCSEITSGETTSASSSIEYGTMLTINLSINSIFYELDTDNSSSLTFTVGNSDENIVITLKGKVIHVLLDTSDVIIENYNGNGSFKKSNWQEVGVSIRNEAWNNSGNIGWYYFGSKTLANPKASVSYPYTLLGWGIYTTIGDSITSVTRGGTWAQDNNSIYAYSTESNQGLFGAATKEELMSRYFQNGFEQTPDGDGITLYPIVAQKQFTLIYSTGAYYDGNIDDGVERDSNNIITNGATVTSTGKPSSVLYGSGLYPNFQSTLSGVFSTSLKGREIDNLQLRLEGYYDNERRGERGFQFGESGYSIDELINTCMSLSEEINRIVIHPVLKNANYTCSFDYPNAIGTGSAICTTIQYNSNSFKFWLPTKDNLRGANFALDSDSYYHYGYNLLGWKVSSISGQGDGTFYVGKEFRFTNGEFESISYTLDCDIRLEPIEEYMTYRLTVYTNYGENYTGIYEGVSYNDQILNVSNQNVFDGRTTANQQRNGYKLLGYAVSTIAPTINLNSEDFTTYCSGNVFGIYKTGNKNALQSRLGMYNDEHLKSDTNDQLIKFNDILLNEPSNVYAYAIWEKLNLSRVEVAPSQEVGQVFSDPQNNESEKNGFEVGGYYNGTFRWNGSTLTVQRADYNITNPMWIPFSLGVIRTTSQNTYSYNPAKKEITNCYVIISKLDNGDYKDVGVVSFNGQVIGDGYHIASSLEPDEAGCHENCYVDHEKGIFYVPIYNPSDSTTALRYKFMVYVNDYPVGSEEDYTDGSRFWFDNSHEQVLSAEINISLRKTIMSAELKDNVIENVETQGYNSTYITSVDKRVVEYSNAKRYMDAASGFFKANPIYDDEGVFASYQSGCSLIELLTALGGTEKINNLNYYKGVDTSLNPNEFRQIPTNGLSERGLLASLTESEFAYIQYLGIKSMIYLAKIDSSFKTNLLTISGHVNGSDKIKDLINNDSINDKSVFEHLKSFTDFVGYIQEPASFTKVTYTGLDGKVVEIYAEGTTYTNPLIQTYIYEIPTGQSLPDIYLTSDARGYYAYNQINNSYELLDLWVLNIGENVKIVDIGYKDSGDNFVSLKTASVGVYGDILFKIENFKTAFAEVVNAEYLDGNDGSFYNYLSVAQMFVNSSTNANAYGTLQKLFKSPEFVAIEFDDMNAVTQASGDVFTIEREDNSASVINSGRMVEFTVRNLSGQRSQLDKDITINKIDNISVTNGYINNTFYFIPGYIQVCGSERFSTVSPLGILKIKDQNGMIIADLDMTDYSINITGVTADGYQTPRITYAGKTAGNNVSYIYGTKDGVEEFLGYIIQNGTASPTVYSTASINTYSYILSKSAMGNYVFVGISQTNDVSNINFEMIDNYQTEVLAGNFVNGGTKYFVFSLCTAVVIDDWNGVSHTYYLNVGENVNLKNLLDDDNSFAKRAAWVINSFEIDESTTNGEDVTINNGVLIVCNTHKKIGLNVVWYPDENLTISLSSGTMTSFDASLSGTVITAKNYITVTGFEYDQWDAVWVKDGVELGATTTLYGTKESGNYQIEVRVSYQGETFTKRTSDITLTVNPIQLDVSASLSNSVYSNQDKTELLTIMLTSSLNFDNNADNLAYGIYSNYACTTSATLKNAGTYYIKIDDTNATHGIYAIPSNPATVEIEKKEEIINANDNYVNLTDGVGFSKFFGSADPSPITAKYQTSLNETVEVYFTRASNDINPGEYALAVTGTYVNYEFNIDSGNKLFEIKARTGALYITADDFAEDYSGTIKSLSFARNTSDDNHWYIYSDGNALIRVYLKDHNGSAYVDANESVINDLSAVTISTDNQIKDAGTYILSISGMVTGYPSVSFVEEQAVKFNVSKKKVKLKNFEKQFDGTVGFATASGLDTVDFDGIISGESLNAAATYAEKGTSEIIANEIAIGLSNLELRDVTNQDFLKNYVLDQSNSDSTGKIVKNSTWALADFNVPTTYTATYGDLTETNITDFSSYLFAVKENDSNLDFKNYLSATITVTDPVYSNGYLKAGTYSATITFTAGDFFINVTGTSTFTLNVSKKELTLTVSNASKHYDGTTALPAEATVTPVGILENDQASVRYDVAFKSHHVNTQGYSESGFDVTLTGEGSENYTPSISLSGGPFTISPTILNLTIDHSGFEFVNDGLNVTGDGIYTINCSEALNAPTLNLTRTGYTFTGLASDENLVLPVTDLKQYISDYINGRNEEVISLTLYSNWIINTYNVSVEKLDENGNSDSERGVATIIDINGDEKTTFNYYDAVIVNAEPANHFAIKEARVNGQQVQVNGTTIEHIYGNKEVKILFRYVNVKIKRIIDNNVNEDIIPYGQISEFDLSQGVSKTGYDINGWIYEKDEETKTVELLKDAIDDISDGEITDDNQVFEFTVVWEAKKHTITFINPDDGTEIEKEIIFNERIDSVEDYPIFEKENHIIGYFTTIVAGINKNYYPVDKYNIDGDSNFTAVWVNNQSTITFNITYSEDIVETGVEGYVESNGVRKGIYTVNLNDGAEFGVKINKTGYVFDCSGIEEHENGNIKIGDKFYILTEDATVTLQIRPRANTVTLAFENAIPQNLKAIAGNGFTNLTYNEDEGTFTTQILTGRTLSAQALANIGYSVEYRSELINVDNEASFEINGDAIIVSGIRKDVTLTLSAVPNSYSATLRVGEGVDYIVYEGSQVSDEVEITATTGIPVKFTVGVKSGYENPYGTSTLEGVVCGFDSATGTITGFTEYFELTVLASPIPYAITTHVVTIDENEDVLDIFENIVEIEQDPVDDNKYAYNSTVTITANAKRGFEIYGWYDSLEVNEETGIITYGNRLSKESVYEFVVKGEKEIFAIFGPARIPVSFEFAGKGSAGYAYTDEELTTKNDNFEETFIFGKDITLKFEQALGYRFVAVYDGNNVALKEGFVKANGSVVDEYDDQVIYFAHYAENLNELTLRVYESMTIIATFEAQESSLTVKASMYINGVEMDSQDGSFAKVSYGQFDGETKVFTKDGVSEIQKEVPFATDQEVYIQIEVYSGYEFKGLTAISQGNQTAFFESVYDYTKNSTSYYVYRIYNLNAGYTYNVLSAKIQAQEASLNINFINEDGEVVNAGRVFVENAFGVLPLSNYTDNVQVVAINGSVVKIEAYTRFGFRSLLESLSTLTKSNETIMISNFSYEEISDNTKGFTTLVKFEVSGFANNSTVSVRVKTETYKVVLYDGDLQLENSIVIESVKIGKKFSLTSNMEVLDRYKDSKPGYELDGFFTAQQGTGVKYIDGNLEVIKTWEEGGYKWNGDEYVTVSNYDPLTKTFKLYACWSRLKSSITLKLIPKAIKNSSSDINIKTVVTNLNVSNAWFDADNDLHADVLYGIDVSIKAVDYASYKFKSWIIILDGEVQGEITSKTYTQAGGFNCKNVEIVANYIVAFGLTAQQGYGSVTAVQEDQIFGVNDEGFVDPAKPITLTATARSGYRFAGWYNVDTNEKLSGEATFVMLADEDNQLSAMYIEARFEPNGVNFEIGEYDDTYGRVEYIIYNDEVEEGVFEALVGEYIEILVDTDNNIGIKWNLRNVWFDREKEYNGKIYFSYIYNVSGDDIKDDKIILIPLFTEDRFTINVSILLNESSDYEKAGAVEISGMVNNRVNQQFGHPFEFKVKAFENYKVKTVKVNNFDVLHFEEDGETIKISSGIFSTIYLDEDEITLEIVFTEDRWIDDASLENRIFKGAGTESNPYIISSAKDLALLAYKVNVQKDTNFSSAYYMLTSDISMEGKFWTPIGDDLIAFSGTFNYMGFNIRGLNIEEEIEEYYQEGVFGNVSSKAQIIRNSDIRVWLIVSLSSLGGIALMTIVGIFIFKARKKKRIHDISK